MSDQGLIYDALFNKPSPVVDITGTTIDFKLQYPPNDQLPNVLLSVGDPGIPVNVYTNKLSLGINLLLKNIPSNFDFIWGTIVEPLIQSTIKSQLDNILGAGKYTATENIPATGRTRARVVSGGPLIIDYWVPGITIDLNGSIGGYSGTVRVTVDAEFVVFIWLNWPTPALVPVASLFNASINPTGGSATAFSFATLKYDAFQRQYNPNLGPTFHDYVFGGYEYQIDNTIIAPPDVSLLSIGFTALGAAAVPLGLLQCIPSTDPNRPSPLTLTLIHPVDPPPVANDPQAMVLAGPVLSGPAQALPGTQIGYTGSDFPPSNVMQIAWMDSCSGTVIKSVVTLDPPQGSPYAIDRTNPAKAQPIFTLPIAQGGPFQATVTDSDGLTQTQPSNSVTLQTLGAVTLVLAYQSTGQIPGPTPVPHPVPGPKTVNLGTVSAGADGTFVGTAVIPATAVVPSIATLQATANGTTRASCSIAIVAQKVPVINLVDPATLVILNPFVNPGLPVTVRGENFPPPTDPSIFVALTINQARQPVLFDAKVGADGTFIQTFTWPANLAAGPYNLLASKVEIPSEWVGEVFQGVEAILAVTEGVTPQ
jgi:hypothetical protein